MNGNVKVSSTQDKVKQVQQAFQDLKDIDVLVGIPQAEESRNGEISNAELLFIHTNGSPLRKIPARPVIEPAIEDDKKVITGILKEALKAVLDGDKAKALSLLEKAGLEGQAASQDWFDNPKNGWPPNSPAVIAAKKKKGSDDPKPLIDTGEMRRAITYVVRKRKG